MQTGRAPAPVSRYLELGVRIHWDEFSQITAVVLLLYLPLAFLALLLQPSLQSILRPGAGDALVLVPRMLLAQLLLRLMQTFLFILLILRLDAQRRGGGDAWDLSEASSRLWQVARVDLAYAFGLQGLAVLTLWVSAGALSFLLGDGPLIFPASIAITAFAVLPPAIRYYFCAFAALLHRDGFRAAFRRSAAASAGAEKPVVLLVLAYLGAWFVLWQLVHGLFGGTGFGQLILQAGIMVTSVSYFFAGYNLYLDLAPPLPGEGGEGAAGEAGRALPLPPGGN